MKEVINLDTINEWLKDGGVRRIKPISDAGLLLNNNRSDLLLSLIHYIHYAIVQLGRHVDYPAHACRDFFSEDSPLRFYAEEAYKDFYEIDVYDENFNDVDVLSDYIRKQDDYVIEQFIWYYLRALCLLDMTDPPDEFNENFDEIIAEQIIVLINSLRWY